MSSIADCPPCDSAEHLRPIGGKSFNVLGVDAVREGVVQLGVLEAALVVRGGQRKEGGVAAGELEDRWSGHG